MQGVVRTQDRTGAWRQLPVEQAVREASRHLEHGDSASALSLLEKAVKLAPHLPKARYLLGVAQTRQKSYTLAIQNLQKALRSDEHNVDYLGSLGEALMTERPEEAIPYLAQAVELGSNNPGVYGNLSALFLDIRKPEDALHICDSGVTVCGPHPSIMGNRGLALQALSRYEESLKSFQTANALLPDDYRVIVNIGMVLRNLGRLAESRDYLERAMALDPDRAEAHYTLGLTLLLAAKYTAGFREYEWRWGIPDFEGRRPNFAQPVWDGRELGGRRILLYGEQGAGDIIQFVRYADFVRARGGCVILGVPQSLVRLLGWIAGYEICTQDEPPVFDVHCSLMSLPGLASTAAKSIPPPAPLIVLEEMKQKWREWLGAKTAARIGVVWAGSDAHPNDRNRSFACRLFAPLLEIPQVEWFSLQVGPASAQLAEPEIQGRIRDLAPELTDYAETAAAISQLDLVITADTSVAHLAGSLGTPVWMLTPFAPDWRWLLDRDDSPWYPSMRLFRQKVPGDWESVMSSVAAALQQLIEAAPGNASQVVAVSPQAESVCEKSADGFEPIRNGQFVLPPISSSVMKLDVAAPYQLVRARQGWMLCNVNDLYMGKAICTYGECCEIEAQFLLRLASFGGMVIEVGANMGIFTVPLGKFLDGQGRKMLAFEPQPVIHRQLNANLALNGLMNVTTLPYACGAETGNVTFPAPDYLCPGNFGAVCMDGPDLPAEVHVPCVRLDDMTGGEHVGLMKIDVEGFELNVLKGATAIIQRSRPIIYLENDRVDRSRDLIEWLWATGYKVWWHTPLLFNPNNFFGVTENLYPDVASVNMLAVPSERAGEIPELPLVTDSSFHPLARRQPGK